MTSIPSGRVPPEASVVPFAGLLAELRSRDFAVGMYEYQDLVLLASRWKGTDVVAFRDAIAALIARNREDVEAIRELFDEWLAREAPAPRPPPSPPERVRWKARHVAVIVLVVVFASGAFAWWTIPRWRDDALPPPPAPTETAAPDPYSDVLPTQWASLPPEPREGATERPWILAVVLVVAALVASAVPQTRKRQRQWAQKYWKSILAARPGPHAYEQRVTPAEAPLPRHVVEDVATILGRALEPEAIGETLDVDESLRITLQEGLHPHLVFEPPPRNVPVLILTDVAWQMRPWRAKVDTLVTGLVRQGVVLDRWYFDGDPMLVSRTPHDRLVPLEQLAATRSESPLMVLGTGQALPADSLERLRRVLKKWTFRTWVHPIGNPQYWRRELARLPVRMWPMTAAGLRAAAVEIARSRDSGTSPLGAAAPRAVTHDDVQRMKVLIAHVPHPSLELAEELRRRFARDIPEEVMLFMGAEGVFYGQSIRLPAEQLQQLMQSASADPERERQVRRYLLEVLRQSEPVRGSVAHLRWQLDEALHRLQLREPGAFKTLQSLAEGPLHEEVRAALAVVRDPRVAPVFEAAARSVPSALPKRPPASLGKRPPLWAWPRWQIALPAAALAVIAALLLGWWTGREAGAVIPHARDAYTLEWADPVLRAGGGKGFPGTVKLYREGMPFGEVRAIPAAITGLPRDAWYDVRAQLPRGNWAASPPVWVSAGTAYVPRDGRGADFQDAIDFRLATLFSSLFNVPPEYIPRRFQPLEAISSGKEALLYDAFRKEFGVQLPMDMNMEELADWLRQQLRDGPAILILIPTSTPSRDARPVLRSRSGKETPAVLGAPFQVGSGFYSVVVNGREVDFVNAGPNELLMRKIPTSVWGTLLIASLPPNVALRDLRVRGQSLTKRSLDLPSGSHTLTLEDDFHSWGTNFVIESGKETRVAINPEPRFGTVLLLGFPSAVPAAVSERIQGSTLRPAPDGNGMVLRAAPGRYTLDGVGTFDVVAGVQTRVVPPEGSGSSEPQRLLEWTFRDTRDLDCPREYAGTKASQCITKGRACVMAVAVGLAKAGDCEGAFLLARLSQCHDRDQRYAVAREGAANICDYLKTR